MTVWQRLIELGLKVKWWEVLLLGMILVVLVGSLVELVEDVPQ